MSDHKCPFCGEPAVKTSIRFDRFRCGTEGPFFDGGKEKYRTGHVCDINMYQRLLATKDAEIERLQADVERLKSVRTQLWSGIGVMRAALTDEQRQQVARICYATTGLCFCGCHETEFDPMMARGHDDEPYIDL